MKTLPSVFKQEILSFKVLFVSFVISFLYFSLSVYILNYRLVLETLIGNFSFGYKTQLLSSLLIGAFTAISTTDLILNIITALLVGINIVLLVKTVSYIRQSKKLRFSVGGSTILGIAAAGCTTCGFSILSIIGITAGISILPYAFFGLHLAAIGLLIFSCIYTLQKINTSTYCKISSK